jgi:hypothetical protein
VALEDTGFLAAGLFLDLFLFLLVMSNSLRQMNLAASMGNPLKRVRSLIQRQMNLAANMRSPLKRVRSSIQCQASVAPVVAAHVLMYKVGKAAL